VCAKIISENFSYTGQVSGVEGCQEQARNDTDIDIGLRTQDSGLGTLLAGPQPADQCVTLGPNKLVYTFLVAQFLMSTSEWLVLVVLGCFFLGGRVSLWPSCCHCTRQQLVCC